MNEYRLSGEIDSGGSFVGPRGIDMAYPGARLTLEANVRVTNTNTKDKSFEGLGISHHGGRYLDSVSKENAFKGHIFEEDGLTKVIILEINNTSNFTSLVYELSKQNDGTIEGNYKGVWGRLPYDVGFCKDLNEFKKVLI